MSTDSNSLRVALSYQEEGNTREAEQICHEILQHDSCDVGAWHLLGVLKGQRGDLPLAVECMRHAIALRPTYAEAYIDLGNALKEQGQAVEAIAAYLRALTLRPLRPEAYYYLGNGFQECGMLEQSLVCFDQAIAQRPDYSEAHNNRGVVLQTKAEFEQAIESYRRAIEIRPDYPEAYNNLGFSHKELNGLSQAAACWQHAIALKPDCSEAHWNHSMLLLLKGDFEHGWPEYEWRWRCKQFAGMNIPGRLWDGLPVAGQTILLQAEQGLGDTIQFIRYAPLVKDRVGSVIVQCQSLLKDLLTSCPGIDRLIGQGELPPSFDCHIPLVSLPGIFKTTLESIPAEIPYLSASPDLIKEWHKRLNSLSGLLVGIAWQGNPSYRADRRRSIPLQLFATLTKVPGVHLISLQKGPGMEQVPEARDSFPMVDFGTELDESLGAFMDTAAIMMNLDLVITSDTSVAHLAGALGVPVWVALPYVPDWRWLLDRSDSPWYPTMRLLRQKAPGDWESVFKEMTAALQDVVAGRTKLADLRQVKSRPASQSPTPMSPS